MRRFQLVRVRDVSGVSGTGVVAYGVQAPDGAVAMRWNGEHRSWAIHKDIESVVTIHGHDGSSWVEWLDDDPS